MQVTHLDGTPSGGQGHDPWKVKANNSGGFTTYWYLPYDDNIGETLLVTATGQSSGLIATTTFFDAQVVDFRQVANEDTTDLVWINSILQENNSTYLEHMSVPQRIIFVGIDSTLGDKHVLTLSHQATKGGDSVHAYDFITSWQQAIDAADFIAPGQNLLSRLFSEACDPNIGPGTDSAMCDALRNGPNSCTGWVDDAMGSVLGDNVASRVTAYEVQHSDRTFKIYGSQPVSLCSLVFLGYSSSGSDFYADYRLVWNSASDSILIEFAGRLALGGDGTGFSYGPGKGASQIAGGPYHFKLDELDGDHLGSQDNQIKGADVIAPCPTCSDVTISGPTSVCPGATNSYSATVNNCTSPSFSWSVSGATIVGATNVSSVSVIANNACGSFTLKVTTTCSGCSPFACSTTVNVQDNTAPVITCPSDKVFDCVLGATGTATATDNCDTNVAITFSDEILSPNCPRVIKRTWIATDDCGNADTCVQTITVQDTTKPVISCPPDKMFDCVMGDAGVATATDNCVPPTITSKDSIVSARCPLVIKRTWTATDTCGNSSSCVQSITVQDTTPPNISGPAEKNVFICQPGELAKTPICAIDNCSNVKLEKISGGGSSCNITGPSPVCCTLTFPADTTGKYVFIFKATDTCGNMAFDTVVCDIQINRPPAVDAKNDTVRLCQKDSLAIIIKVDDDTGDVVTLKTCANVILKQAPAPFQDTFKFFADTCGTYRFCFKAVDRCTVAYDTAVWIVKVQTQPPIVNAGPDTTKFLCGPSTIKLPICATDPDCADTIKLEKISGGGTFPMKTGPSPVCETLRFIADTSGTYCFVFEATDLCGRMDLDTVCCKVDLNEAPIIIANDTTVIICRDPQQFCFPVKAIDPDGDSVCLEKIEGPGDPFLVCGKPQADGQFCLTLHLSDTLQPLLIIFQATEFSSCQATAFGTKATGSPNQATIVDTVRVTVLPGDPSQCKPCITAIIGEDTASPGSKVRVPLTIVADTADIGGFTLCLEYDPALLTFINLERGEFFDQPGPFEGSYMWNYLVWRNNPSTVIHKFKLCIIGIGKLYYYGGICMPAGSQGVLYVEFRLSNNELYRCMRTPVIWEQLDPQCVVNAFSNCSGNKVSVFNDTLYYNPRICDSTALWPKKSVSNCAQCLNGGVVFKCDVDPIVMGDINANGFAYEIGDAVLFANYFISGPSVFSPDPEIRERQIASTDINRDGLTLSIADLVFLLRILSGDTQPLGGAKLAPSAQAINLVVTENLVESQSLVDLGAILLTFRGEAVKLEPIITGLEVMWGIKEGETKLLIYGMRQGEKIPAGISKLVNIYGEVELVKVEAADYLGTPVDVNILLSPVKPESYLLSQNYPNPFNATTTIKFATPIDGKVTLKIYNVAGQVVRVYQEFMNAGYHSITWDGSNTYGEKVSSGVYLYKLQIGEFTEIRKMTLLK